MELYLHFPICIYEGHRRSLPLKIKIFVYITGKKFFVYMIYELTFCTIQAVLRWTSIIQIYASPLRSPFVLDNLVKLAPDNTYHIYV